MYSKNLFNIHKSKIRRVNLRIYGSQSLFVFRRTYSHTRRKRALETHKYPIDKHNVRNGYYWFSRGFMRRIGLNVANVLIRPRYALVIMITRDQLANACKRSNKVWWFVTRNFALSSKTSFDRANICIVQIINRKNRQKTRVFSFFPSSSLRIRYVPRRNSSKRYDNYVSHTFETSAWSMSHDSIHIKDLILIFMEINISRAIV